MTENIRKEYRKAGISPPNGKGIHTLRFHKIAIDYMKKGYSKNRSYKIAMGALRKHAIKPGHRKTV